MFFKDIKIRLLRVKKYKDHMAMYTVCLKLGTSLDSVMNQKYSRIYKYFMVIVIQYNFFFIPNITLEFFHIIVIFFFP